MKYNYLFFYRPVRLLLAVLWLTILPGLASAQQIAVSVSSMQDTVNYRGESVQTFNIRNTGNATLTWSAQVNGADPTERHGFTAGPVILRQDFEEFPFTDGWTGQDNYDPDGYGWITNDYYDDIVNLPGGPNVTGGAGLAAMMLRYAVNTYDNELRSPLIDVNGYRDFHLQYKANFYQMLGPDELNLDIQLNDSGPWTTILHWIDDHGGGEFMLPGETVNVSLRDHIPPGTNSFRIRWHYTDNEMFIGYSGNYVEIDEVIITAESQNWLNLLPSSGSIEPGDSVAVIANFDGFDREPGAYTTNLVINSNDPSQSSITIPASLTVLSPADIAISPGSLEATVEAGQPAIFALNITNAGQSKLKYKFNTPGVRRPFTTVMYETSFENFDPTYEGILDGQEGWSGSWATSTQYPATGYKHITGSFGSVASPVVSPGTSNISATVFKTYLTEFDFTPYQVSPRSADGTPLTNIAIPRHGLMNVLAWDTTQAVYRDYAVNLPVDTVHGILIRESYFEMWIIADRTTGAFSIYTDGILRFSGKGQPVEIQQVVFGGPDGYPANVDDFGLYNGLEPYFTPLFDPMAGLVPGAASESVAITFQPNNLAGGIYRDTLELQSNDPAHPLIYIPVALTIMSNAAPVLAPIDTLEVTQFSQETVTFTATDADNDPVIVSLQNPPSFVTQQSSTNGSAQYFIKPLANDVGEYDLIVRAVDSNGATDSAYLHISVIRYGAKAFYFYNIQTNTRLETFTDSVVLDVARPDYNALAIQADTEPATVGSVKFWWDSHVTNIDNNEPYRLNPLVLLLPRAGHHELRARAFTKANANGKKGTPREAIVNIINSSAIASVDVVHPNGDVLTALTNGSVLNISQPGYYNINLRANPNGPLRSVVFKLNGSFHRVDNVAPYVLHGTLLGNDIPWPATPGNYTLEVTPYSQWYGLGVPGQTLTITFQVINSSASARQITDDIIPEETQNARFTLYPVPVSDLLYVNFPAEEEGSVRMLIHDTQGRFLYNIEHSTKTSHAYDISTGNLGLNAGVYYFQVQYSNGRREIRKFIKE